MRVQAFLQKIFQKSRAKLDKRLHRLVLEVAETLSRHKKLSIFGLGRSLNRSAKVKHNIKTIDRLFGNPRLAAQGVAFYQDCASHLIGNNKRPTIIVDWSGLTRCGAFHFIRASVPVGGRALPLLDMAFPLKEYQTQKAHKRFIVKLKSILPDDCSPIVLTDAGFRCPWFDLIKRIGWDFVGRVRNKTQYQELTDGKWHPIKTLYARATTCATYLFETKLAKANPITCQFYLMKAKKKYRVKRNLIGKKVQCGVSKKHAKGGNEPWLIVTSLNPNEFVPHDIMNLYAKRMQIEEGFRDLKNTRLGFSLRHCRSYTVERLNVALLISAIAMLLLWLLGLIAKKKELHFGYQANTIKTRNVLSSFMLGWQALTRDIRKITLREGIEALLAIAESPLEQRKSNAV